MTTKGLWARLVALLLVVVAINVAITWIVVTMMRADPMTDAAVDTNIVSLVNRVRGDQRGAPLLEDEALNQSARTRALEIAQANLFEHDRPDGSKFYTAIYKGTGFAGVGENLAQCMMGNQTVVDAWVRSPLHYQNILGTLKDGDNWTHVGYARVWDEDRQCSVNVMHFGRLE